MYLLTQDVLTLDTSLLLPQVVHSTVAPFKVQAVQSVIFPAQSKNVCKIMITTDFVQYKN